MRPTLDTQEKFYEDILKAYNKLKKKLGRNPTQGELLRATGRKSQTAIRTAVKKFGLELFNKPGETKVPKEISQEARKKTTEKIRANKVITEPTLRDGKLIFPSKEMEKEFKDEVRKKYKYPRDSLAAKKAGVLTQKEFYKKFYKTRSPTTTIGDIGIMAKELNLKYPKQTYEGDLKQKKILEKRRTGLISDVSGKPEERKIVKAKREMGFGRSGKNLDLAHRASLKQFKDFGLPYLADNLGLDTRKVNQEIILPFEDEINSLHKKRMKLIKNVKPGNVPIEVSKGLEVINKQLSDISMKTNGALQAVLIDEKTLKPFVFNKNYANVLGQGLIDKPVSQLTDANIDFFKGTFSESSKQATKQLNNLKNDLIKTAQGSPTACKAVLNKLVGGGVAGCVEEIKRNPTAAAEKISGLKPTSAALGKVKNAARSFLSFMGLGKGEGVKIFRGERAGASGKMAKYIPGTSEVEFVPYSDKLKGRFFTTSKEVAKQFADDPSKIKSLTIPQKDFNIGTNLARRINVDQMADQLILPKSVINKLKDGTLKYDSPAFRNILRTLGKGKIFTATAAVGAGAGALVKAFRNDDPTTYLTNDKQANAMILDTADQLEREERQAAVGDAPELLDEANIAANLGVTAAAIPGSKKVFDARKKKGFGAVRAGLGPVGKALSGFATPLGIAATTPLNVASQVYQGDSAEEILTDPLNYLGPAFASTLTKEATVGMPKGGMLNKALRLGMSPAGVRGVTKFLGLPGLALSLGYEGYDQYKKYTEGRGFVYNLLNKDE